MKIALICNTDKMLESLRPLLEKANYAVSTFTSAANFIDTVLKKEFFHLYLICLHDDDIDDIALIKAINKRLKAPTIVLSDSQDNFHIYDCYAAGVDEYMRLPCPGRELLVRLHAVARRCYEAANGTILRAEDLVLDKNKDVVTLCGEEIRLTPVELKILKLLMDNINNIVSNQEIMLSVWGCPVQNGYNIISQNVCRLKKKIGKDKIVNIKGEGYKFVMTELF